MRYTFTIVLMLQSPPEPRVRITSPYMVFQRHRYARNQKPHMVHILHRYICARLRLHHRYISSKGLVSLKQLSQTSLTTFAACTSSLTPGRASMESVARRRTQFWSCSVMRHWFLVKNSRVKRHSPERVEARIWLEVSGTHCWGYERSGGVGSCVAEGSLAAPDAQAARWGHAMLLLSAGFVSPVSWVGDRR
jgi:hypothetical protein